MIKRSISGLLAAICVIAGIPSVPTMAVGSYTMNVKVECDRERKEISPYIYGVNEFTTSNLKNVTVNSSRQGGNRYTGYNWETNWSNAGSDWQHTSDTNIGDLSDGAGYAVRSFSKSCSENNVPYKLASLQMAGYVAADKDGNVSEEETAPSERWDKVEFRKGGELSLTPDLTDGTVYMDEYVNFIVETLGDASTKTGIQAYSLDDEPVLWNDTHPLLHPNEVTNSELITKSIELAKVIKEIDPKAEVFGPAFWGVLPCVQLGDTDETPDSDWRAVSYKYDWYLDYYLQQMADAEKDAGMRLIDAVDVHYYAQDCYTDDAILQSARSLYDPTYVEDSWLQPSFGEYLPFLPKIKESVDKYYPGTKISISEYNLANILDEKSTGKSVVSGIAEAEALGCFAENEVYFATYWGTLPECPYVRSAINLYTNYDGNGAKFGDTLLESETDDISKATAYASINGDDESEMTLVLSNKDKEKTENAHISISGSEADYRSAVVYAITQDSSDIRIIDVQNEIDGNELVVSLPPLSVAQVVLSDSTTDKTVYEKPEVETRETTYHFNSLEKSDNGYYMIPLGDKKHLKEIVINYTVTSNKESTSGGGGGGLCFNHLIPEGKTEEVWGNKAVNFSLGTGDAVIPFDNEFTIKKNEEANTDEVVKAVCNDEYAELQEVWWKYSENDKDGNDLSIKYNYVTLIYEYSPSDTGVEGDVNSDGIFSIADLVSLQKWLLNDGTELKNWQTGDMVNDGRLDTFDLSAMRKALLENE